MKSRKKCTKKNKRTRKKRGGGREIQQGPSIGTTIEIGKWYFITDRHGNNDFRGQIIGYQGLERDDDWLSSRETITLKTLKGERKEVQTQFITIRLIERDAPVMSGEDKKMPSKGDNPYTGMLAEKEIAEYNRQNKITRSSWYKGTDSYIKKHRKKWTDILKQYGISSIYNPSWDNALIWANSDGEDEGQKISGRNLFGNVNDDSGSGAGSVSVSASVSTTEVPTGEDFEMLDYSDDSDFDELKGGKRHKKTRKKRGGAPREITVGDIWKHNIRAHHLFEYAKIEEKQETTSGGWRIKFSISDKQDVPGDGSFMLMPEKDFRDEYDKFPEDSTWSTTPDTDEEQGGQGGGKRRRKTRKYTGKKYPYKNITKKEAIADFIKLKSTTNPRSLNGLEIVNYGTEKLRVKTKYRGKSLIERWRDKKTRKTLKKFANRLYKGPYTDDLLHAYRSAIALSWGTLSSMRTSAALQMYKKYNAKKVLDFTAGWGSRMAAALAADIDYIGIDSNKSLKKGYNKIIKTVKKHTKSKVKLFFQPAETVNYSKLDYDFVFTSPPYEYLELYEHMKNYEGTKKIKQAHSANDKRRKNDGFYDTFLIPTIKEIYKHLPKGKWMCLNVPDLMYDKIKKKWKACNKKEDYMISKRVGSNMKSDDRRGQEFVYCWNK